MKKKTVLAIIAAAAIASAMALAPGAISAGEQFSGRECGMSGEGMGKPFKYLDRLQYHLGLSDVQVEKIFRIDQDYREKYFKNRNNSEAIESLRAEREKAVEGVLTDKQKERYKDFRDSRKNRMERHDRSGGEGCQRGR